MLESKDILVSSTAFKALSGGAPHESQGCISPALLAMPQCFGAGRTVRGLGPRMQFHGATE
jgi:hypothetical protein